LILELWFWFF